MIRIGEMAIMLYDFYNPTRLVTGEGCVDRHSGELAKLGKRCLILTGKTAARKSGALDEATAALKKEGIEYRIFDEVEPNPSLLGAQKAGLTAREFGAEFVLGIGGGSPLDAAKAAAVFAANPMESDAAEIYKRSWQYTPLPVALIGTTAGTGSEFDSASVLTRPDGVKQSVARDDCFPKVSFCDPRYTYSLPIAFTVSTALDALCHALEGYFSKAANEMSDMFAIRSAKLLLAELPGLEGKTDSARISPETRANLYYASVLAGAVIAKCGTAYCHTLSYYFTETHGVPHGTACAVFLTDFIRRGVRAAPEKASRLFSEAGGSADELCALVDRIHNFPKLKLSDEECREIALRGEGTPNFQRTLPDGYTAAEAAELLKQLFT